MALRSIVESLDDVPEGVREHYTENEDGEFELDIEGFSPQSAQSALKVERDKRKRAEKKLRAFGDDTPETIANLREEVTELQAGKGDDVQAALASERKKHEKAAAALEAERESWKGRALGLMKQTVATPDQIRQLGGVPGAISRIMQDGHVRLTEDGDDPAMVIVGLDGEETDLKGLLGQLKKSGEYDWAFSADGPAGAGGDGRGAGGAGGSGSNGQVTKRSQLKTPAAAAAFIKEHGREAFDSLDRSDWTAPGIR